MSLARRTHALLLFAAMTIGLALAPRRAEAETRLELGGAYWVHEGGAFTAMLALDAPVARWLAVGGRAGGLLATDPARGGIPIDLELRIHVARPVFLEIMGGPWLLFSGETVRGHFAVAIGTTAGRLVFAAELGYLDPEPIFGAKIGFRL